MTQHFLTTICHGDVRLGPEVVDDTEYGIMRGLKTKVIMFYLTYVWTGSTSIPDSRSESLGATDILDYHNPTTYAHKVHYRIVFKEQGTTIDNVRRFHDVLKTLEDAVKGLSFSDHVPLKF
jgi:hypothetical protein